MNTRIAVLPALLALAACSGTSQEACLASALGDKRCTGRVLEMCDGSHWVISRDCNADNLTCLTTTSADCATPLQAGVYCTSSDQCDRTLACAIPYGYLSGVCADTCNALSHNLPACIVSGQVCVDIGGYFGLCADKVAAGELCYDDKQCPAAASRCEWFRLEPIGIVGAAVGACAASCDFSEINLGQGSCDAGFSCLKSPYGIDFQFPNSTTQCSSNTECNTASGYACLAYATGYSFCARSHAACGHVAPMYGSRPDTAASGFDQSTLCSVGQSAALSDYRNFCGVSDPTATVTPYCHPLTTADSYTGVCAAGCVTPADCGAGYDCVAPGTDVAMLWDLEAAAGSTAAIACDPAGANVCSADYSCQTIQYGSSNAYHFCAKPSMTCTPL